MFSKRSSKYTRFSVTIGLALDILEIGALRSGVVVAVGATYIGSPVSQDSAASQPAEQVVITSAKTSKRNRFTVASNTSSYRLFQLPSIWEQAKAAEGTCCFTCFPYDKELATDADRTISSTNDSNQQDKQKVSNAFPAKEQ